MGFTVAHGDSQQHVWGSVAVDDTLYVGQIVRVANEGFLPLGQASGVGDITNKNTSIGIVHTGTAAVVNNVPYGIIVGTNAYSPTYNSTYMTESIAYATPSTTTGTYVGHEGPWARGDNHAMVEVAPINANTVLRAPLFVDTYGTAPTVETLSGTPTTTTATSSGTDEDGVKGLSTIYFRSGGCAGQYRVTDDTSSTAVTWDLPTVGTAASGDTIVRVNLRPFGLCRAQVDSEATFIDVGATVTSSYFLIDVLRLDLSVAGGEYIEFRFHPMTFNAFDYGNYNT